MFRGFTEADLQPTILREINDSTVSFRSTPTPPPPLTGARVWMNLTITVVPYCCCHHLRNDTRHPIYSAGHSVSFHDFGYGAASPDEVRVRRVDVRQLQLLGWQKKKNEKKREKRRKRRTGKKREEKRRKSRKK